MPRSASSKQPARRSVAPVKAPFSWPKISLSSSVSGIAAQLIATNGARRARAQLVNRLRDQLLAGAGLAEDQHRGRRRRGLLEHLIQRAHRRAVADDAAEAAAIVQLPPQRLVLALLLVDLGEPLEQALQLVRIERLGEVILGAGLDRFDRRVDGALRGQQDHLDVVDLGLQRLQQLDAAHARHDQIGDDDRGTEGRDLLERLGAVGGLLGGKSPGPHQLGQAAARCGIVLDDQDAFGGMRRSLTFFNLSSGAAGAESAELSWPTSTNPPRPFRPFSSRRRRRSRGQPGRRGSKSCSAPVIRRRSCSASCCVLAGIRPISAPTGRCRRPSSSCCRSPTRCCCSR